MRCPVSIREIFDWSQPTIVASSFPDSPARTRSARRRVASPSGWVSHSSSDSNGFPWLGGYVRKLSPDAVVDCQVSPLARLEHGLRVGDQFVGDPVTFGIEPHHDQLR
jgi:hypothetical protein